MQIELTVVGIRNYCEGGEEGYPQLFARLPQGAEVYLHIDPPGSKFSGAISVFDSAMSRIGYISNTEIPFITLQVQKADMLPVLVCGHSAEDNCLYVRAENTEGIGEARIKQIEPEPGESVFETTENDLQLTALSDRMRMELNRILQADSKDISSLQKIAGKYVELCCTSLDGDNAFKCTYILNGLKTLCSQFAELEPIRKEINEKKKDLGRKYNDVKVTVYHEQYERIKAAALSSANGISELEAYRKTLEFRHAGTLSREVLQQEIAHLSDLLYKEFEGDYVKSLASDDVFATKLYFYNYSLRATYILYTRRIKLEFLTQLLEAGTGNDIAKVQNANVPAAKNDAELCHFIHPAVTEDVAKLQIHQEIVNLVHNSKVPDICKHLNQMERDGKILQPMDARKAHLELLRLGLPDETKRGYKYNNFATYYRKDLNK